MVGSDRVAEDTEAAGGLDAQNGSGLEREVFEERRFLDVSALAVPAVGLSRFTGNFIPSGVLFGEISVQFLENFRLKGGFHGVPDFFAGGPEIAEINCFSILA